MIELEKIVQRLDKMESLLKKRILNKLSVKRQFDDDVELVSNVEIALATGRSVKTFKGVTHKEFERIFPFVQSGTPVFLAGPAGSGKTSICKRIAEVLELPFTPITLTADTPASVFKGRRPLNEFLGTPFIDAYENGGVILLDEIDSADANVLLSINTALAGSELDLPLRFENPVAYRHKDFYCVSAANTFGSGADRMYVGRNQLDAAFLDRFIQIEVDYDPNIEKTMGHRAIVETVHWLRKYVTKNKWRRIVSSRMISKLQVLIDNFPASERIDAMEFILASWSLSERTQILNDMKSHKFRYPWPSDEIELEDELGGLLDEMLGHDKPLKKFLDFKYLNNYRPTPFDKLTVYCPTGNYRSIDIPVLPNNSSVDVKALQELSSYIGGWFYNPDAKVSVNYDTAVENWILEISQLVEARSKYPMNYTDAYKVRMLVEARHPNLKFCCVIVNPVVHSNLSTPNLHPPISESEIEDWVGFWSEFMIVVNERWAINDKPY